MDWKPPIPFTELQFGSIIGIVDAYGAVHHKYTECGNPQMHHELWPGQNHCCWRWSYSQNIWWIGSNKPNEEQFDAIQRALTKHYGIQWWDNGHFDIDHFMDQIDREGIRKTRRGNL